MDPPLDLIRSAVRGDDAALTLLLTESYAELRGYLAGRIPADLRSRVDADDLVQETHVEVFRRIGSFTAEDATAFGRWVWTIAANRLRNAIKHRRAAKRGGGRRQVTSPGLEASITTLLNVMAATTTTPSRVSANAEGEQAVAAALQLLPEDYQEAVRLVYLQGLPVAAAAENMKRSERAVHNLCYKARGRLRQLLGTRSDYLDNR